MVISTFRGRGVGFGFGIGCGFGIGWGFGGSSLQTLGIGAGGGCGVGLGLGWGFGVAYGTPYMDSKPAFKGFDFKKIADLKKLAALLESGGHSDKPQMQNGGDTHNKQLIAPADENHLPR